jgi:hypothetical protein
MLIYFIVLSAQPLKRRLSFAFALLKFHAGLLTCFISPFALLLDFYGYLIFPALLALGVYLMISGYKDGKKLKETLK